jgi:hypothetical protein
MGYVYCLYVVGNDEFLNPIVNISAKDYILLDFTERISVANINPTSQIDA